MEGASGGTCSVAELVAGVTNYCQCVLQLISYIIIASIDRVHD